MYGLNYCGHYAKTRLPHIYSMAIFSEYLLPIHSLTFVLQRSHLIHISCVNEIRAFKYSQIFRVWYSKEKNTRIE